MNALTAWGLSKKGCGYGSGSADAQRGRVTPQTFDCSGLVEEGTRLAAPALWPGEHVWTVVSEHTRFVEMGLPVTAAKIAPNPGDIAIFGADKHIGIVVDAGRVVSALNVAHGVCVTDIATMVPPLTYIVRTGLELPPMDLVPASPLATCDLSGGSVYADLMSTQPVPSGVYPGHATGVPFLGYQTRPSLGTGYPPVKIAWVILPTFGLAIIGATCVSNVILPAAPATGKATITLTAGNPNATITWS
jgi:hypothetical protein